MPLCTLRGTVVLPRRHNIQTKNKIFCTNINICLKRDSDLLRRLLAQSQPLLFTSKEKTFCKFEAIFSHRSHNSSSPTKDETEPIRMDIIPLIVHYSTSPICPSDRETDGTRADLRTFGYLNNIRERNCAFIFKKQLLQF